MKTIKIFYTLLIVSKLCLAQNVTISPSGITPIISGTIQKLSYEAIRALPNPQTGDMAYDISYKCLRIYNGFKWINGTSNEVSQPNFSAWKEGNTLSDIGFCITSDTLGNIYIAGNFQGTIQLNIPSGPVLTSGGLRDIFIVKYNSAGLLQWATKAGGTSNESTSDIAVDKLGNVFVSGVFFNTSVFGTTTITSSGFGDIFLTKLSPSGTFLWTQKAGGVGVDYIGGLVIDNANNAYISGGFSDVAIFGSFSTLANSKDVFIAKYNSAGTCTALKSFGNANTSNCYDICIDNANNIYQMGTFGGTMTFGTGVLAPTATAINEDLFITKFNTSTLLWDWVKTANASQISPKGIDINSFGMVYVTGTFQGISNFDGRQNTANGVDIFIGCYNNLGIFQWVKKAGGDGDDVAYDIVVDVEGNALITGYITDVATFGHTTIPSKNTDLFVAKYSNQGITLWAKSLGGIGVEKGYAITIGALGQAYITGSFTGLSNFGISNLQSSGLEDTFVCKISE
jgi:Beta-propeller repeat